MGAKLLLAAARVGSRNAQAETEHVGGQAV